MTDPTPLRPGAPAAPPQGRALASLLEADFTVQLRNVRSLIASFLLPLLMLVALFAGKHRPVLGDSAVRVALCLMLGVATIAVLGYSLAVARDRDGGVFQRLRVTPTTPWTIMISRLIVEAAVILAMSVMVFLVAGLFLGVMLSPVEYALTIVVIVFGAAEFLAIGQALVGFVKSAETLNAVGRLIYIPLFALGLFGQTDVLGTTFELISRWSPGGVLATMLVGAMQPSTWNAGTWGALVVSVAYAVVFAGLGIRFFQWGSR